MIFFCGYAGVLINYLADLQRVKVRARDGKCRVWGGTPKIIDAEYQTHDGEVKQSLLLASGWWGLSQHFQYNPELFTSFFPYFYVCFLTVLLLDRAFRHDKRCADKYGDSWDQYCKQVPYKMIPYLF